jgi:myo-inositol-1(or 4)-monophosphatase
VSPHELGQAAAELAQAAGAVLRSRLDQVRDVQFKGPGHSNLVTDADRAAEEVIVEGLTRRFPDHGLLAEESGALRSGAVTWVVDPLDGTTNYAHGVPYFSVSIAAEAPWQGGVAVVAGVVFDPMRAELFSAVRGEGAFLNGRRLRVSDAPTLDRALLCTGFPYDVGARPDLPLGLFTRLVQRAQGLRRMGSAALDLASVAAGRFDGFFEFGLKPWDIAAGGLLVEEAQGVMRRVDGAPWNPRFGDVVAAGPRLFEELGTLCEEYVRQHAWVPTAFDLQKA